MARQIDIIKHFKQYDGHGNGLIIKGRVRSGKTYLVSILIKLLLKNGFAVICNVRFKDGVYKKYAGRLFYIQSDIDFFKAYLKVRPDTPIILVWDDAQSSKGFKSTHVVRKEGDLLSSFLIFIGKFEANYIFIAHQKYIPDCLMDGFEPLIIYKMARHDYWLGEGDLLLEPSDIKRNCIRIPVPKPEIYQPLPIMSKAFARFSFGLDLDALYDHLGQFHIGEDLRKGVTEYLNEWENKNQYAHLEEMSYKDIYLALCLKKGKVLSDGCRIRELINTKIVQEARHILRELGYK